MQNTYLDIAKQNLLEPYSIDNNHLDVILAKLMSKGANHADLYFQYTENEAWVLDEGIIKSGSYSIDKGVGVRSVYGEKTAFAYTDQISLQAIEQAVKTNISIGEQDTTIKIPSFNILPIQKLYTDTNPLNTLTSEQKIELLQYIDTTVRRNNYIKNVIASISAEYDVVLIARADGKLVADIRPLVRLSITIMLEKDGKHEKGNSGGGGRFTYNYFTHEVINHYIQDALTIAHNNLEAKPAPAGMMPVVLGSGWPGVLLHEAIGHGLEGDFNRKGSSAFSNKIGQQVAAKGITIVDDGTIQDRRGSLNIDDEGNPTSCNVLIEDGILTGYMQDEMNAKLMGMPVTGNGRRESYASIPMPRMTNTHMLV
jgi:TldD protein